MRKRKNEILEKILGNKVVAYRADLAKAFGSVNLALLWSQFYYWDGKGKDPDWTYKTRGEIYDELGLSRHQQEVARRKGRRLGVLEEKKKGIPRKIYFKINKEKTIEILLQWKDRNSPISRLETSRQAKAKSDVSAARNRPAITENTSESTPETTTKEKRGAKRPVRRCLNHKCFEEYWKKTPVQKDLKGTTIQWQMLDHDIHLRILADMEKKWALDVRWKGGGGPNSWIYLKERMWLEPALGP